MRINENLVLQGQTCVLVPYRREHVDKYHQWMQDPHLQATTASEPLTMEEEYAMQASWRDDEDKLTFIVLDSSLPGDVNSWGAMAGDVNIYLNDPEERSTGEIEIMIAESASRRKGIAQEALKLMMAYCVQHLGITRFRAKIIDDNEPSISLFQKLGYTEVKRVAIFHEVHFELECSPGSPSQTTYSQMELKSQPYEGA